MATRSDYFRYDEEDDDEEFEKKCSKIRFKEEGRPRQPRKDYVQLQVTDWEFFHDIVLYNHARCLTAKQCYDEMSLVFPGICPELCTIRAWYTKLNRGESLEKPDETRGRKELHGVSFDIKPYIDEQPHIALSKLCQLTGHGWQVIKRTAEDELGMIQVASRWVPHLLTTPQAANRKEIAHVMYPILAASKQYGYLNTITGDESFFYLQNPASTTWVAIDDAIPVAQRSSHYGKKVMVTIFFNGYEVVFIHAVAEGKTMTSETFVDEILKPMASKLEADGFSMENKITIHFDNAPVHKSAFVKKYLETSIYSVMPHPPYSPDIAPSDFFLFGYVKHLLQGRTFPDRTSLLDAINTILKSISSTMFYNTFDDWLARLKVMKKSGSEYLQ